MRFHPVLVTLVVAAGVSLPVASAADARRLPPRQGGTVHQAWPSKHARGRATHRPAAYLVRYLARQVGAVKIRSRPRVAPGVAMTVTAAPTTLRLVRSYTIPVDDPAYARVTNLSWTYDNALAAMAFVVSGQRTQAEQLLDQLAALQRTDGSLEYAYDTSTGESRTSFRTGSIAWVGLAFEQYARVYNSSRYRKERDAVVAWLLARQLTDPAAAGYGLLRGGPDVEWASAQHNLLAWFVLRDAAKTFKAAGPAADLLQAAILRDLLVGIGDDRYFTQGLGDGQRPLDAQNLGIMFLLQTGRAAEARLVSGALLAQFGLAGRAIAISKEPENFNATYTGRGPFAGFRPYADPVGSPDVLWMEGTAQATLALARAGVKVDELVASMDAWAKLTEASGLGLLGADSTVSTNPINEYHVWPTSAATSWFLLQRSDPSKLVFTSAPK